MAETKQPERLCVGCRQLHPKNRLLRIVRSPAGDISIDPTGKAAGRGAYLCPRWECFMQARKHNGFAWSLKGRCASTLYEKLEVLLKTIPAKE